LASPPAALPRHRRFAITIVAAIVKLKLSSLVQQLASLTFFAVIPTVTASNLMVSL
jgi:hypothetical protein